MSDLQDLYQELILDHNKRPRNRRVIEHAGCHALGHNPLCGDKVDIYVNVDEHGVITDASFEGKGCAISTASASLMTEAIKGRTVAEARAMFAKFHDLVTGEHTHAGGNGLPLGKLEAFSGVGKYPARVKCATLAWHTLLAALERDEHTVTTE